MLLGSTYFWDFGDGNTSTQQSPTHTYASTGSYYYCLTIDSCPPVCDSVIVNNNTPCNINASFTVVNNGNGNYSFTNTSTGGTNYYWNFGDGNTSTATNPTHQYLTNGIFPVQLITYDSNCQSIYTITLTVTAVTNPISCNASFLMFPDSNSTNIIVFNTSTGNNLTYFWDFGDGNTSTQQYPGYTYSTPGPFWLCLTISDNNNCTSTYCDSIGSNGVVLKQTGFTINVQAPIATGINKNKSIVTDFNTYPNPIKENLTIELNLIEQAQVEIVIVDLLGNTIANISNKEMNSGTNKLSWNVTDIANGIYFLNIKTNNSIQTKKLMINK
jgi:PKD repeat protein